MNIDLKEHLKDGELFAGILLGKNGAPDEGVVLLAGETRLTWGEAVKWAESIGGTLPTRREQSLLFANLTEEFKNTWYWSSEQYGSTGAWMQNFGHGGQYCNVRSDSYHARAIRRFKIS